MGTYQPSASCLGISTPFPHRRALPTASLSGLSWEASAAAVMYSGNLQNWVRKPRHTCSTLTAQQPMSSRHFLGFRNATFFIVLILLSSQDGGSEMLRSRVKGPPSAPTP